MIKDIVLEKDVITTKHYLFRGITTEFMTFERYRKARSMANMKVYKKNVLSVKINLKKKRKLIVVI